MFGSTGILITLIVATIVLAAVFLVRSSITVGATGKVLAFVGLCVLPALCIGTGMSFQNQRSKQTRFCVSCHELQGKSLYLLNPNYIPAHHFQDHLVPPDKACFTCHTDYAIYGPFRDKLKGLWNMSIQYFSTPPKTIHIPGGYNNIECLQCHAGTRDFEDHLNQMAPIALLTTNKVSCLSCHNLMHNVSQVDHLKMWTGGAVLAAVVSGSSAPAPAKAKPGAATGSSAGTAAATKGKGIFDSHGCSGCHGASGGGGVGPALTHISSQYPPAKLTALLKAPTSRMKAAGMVPLTLKAADMKALVSYVTSFGGTSSAKAKPGATTGASKPPTGSSSATTAQGKSIFDSHHCSGCHGASGGGGVGPALTHISSQYPPAKLTALLKAPTSRMKAAGMVPLTLKAADMKALVSYVTSFGGTSAAKAKPGTTGGASKAPTGSSSATATRGKGIFDSHHCSGCHGASGGGGSGPALTHISSQYPPDKLTALLKAPTARMKAAGMVPLTLKAADLKALVSYVSSFGGTSANSSAASPAAGAPMNKLESKGELIFNANVCAMCHGTGGVAGSTAGPPLAGTRRNFTPATLTTLLQHPTALMTRGGMPAVSLGGDDLKALVAYVIYITTSKSNHP